MAYQRLELSTSTPEPVRCFIEQTIENLYFCDVHAMLRLPLPEKDISAGLNFSITQVLMSVISGVSITLYETKGDSGQLFMGVIEDFFPWDEEPISDVQPRAAAGMIYDIFRNPLTHSAGLLVDWREKQRFLVQKNYVVKIKRLLSFDKASGHTEEWVEALERSTSRPKMGQTLKVEENKKVLHVEGLYWCTRRMIQKLTHDSERMAKAGVALKMYG